MAGRTEGGAVERKHPQDIRLQEPRCKHDTALYPRYTRHPGRLETTMSGTVRSSEGLDQRRRKLLFRSWHRGIREMDLILGGFADTAIATLTDAELNQYEHLLELQDADLLSWFTGASPVPAAFDTPLLKKIMASRAA